MNQNLEFGILKLKNPTPGREIACESEPVMEN
jgi:hypothetical protein